MEKEIKPKKGHKIIFEMGHYSKTPTSYGIKNPKTIFIKTGINPLTKPKETI